LPLTVRGFLVRRRGGYSISIGRTLRSTPSWLSLVHPFPIKVGNAWRRWRRRRWTERYSGCERLMQFSSSSALAAVMASQSNGVPRSSVVIDIALCRIGPRVSQANFAPLRC